MQGVTESMAGRAAIMQLLPFSLGETHRVSLLHGGYPEVVARPVDLVDPANPANGTNLRS